MIGFTLFHVLRRMKLVPLLTKNRVSKQIYHFLNICLSISFLYFSIFPTQLSCHFNLKLIVCLVSCKVVECATQGALIDLAAVYGGSLEMKWNLNRYFCFNLKAGQLSKHQYYNFYSTSFVEKMVVISTKVVQWPTLMSSLPACR